MPRIALLSDIHANLHALRAVLDAVQRARVDRLVFLGDVVGYGPHPAECVKLVRETGEPCVQGNHDFYTTEAVRRPSFLPQDAERLANPVWAGIAHAARQLTPDQIEWLDSRPRVVDAAGALVAHAALHESFSWPYLLSAQDARPTLDILVRMKIAITFVGHTHRQEWFSLPATGSRQPATDDRFPLDPDTRYAVVVGSVGQPRTHDKRAAWTVWDSEARQFEFHRTEYPVELTVRAIHEAGLPAHSAQRLGSEGGK